MNAQMTKIATLTGAMLLTLIPGTIAIADDTELLLVSPSASAATPPNIMFILDTSGSMGNNVNTTEPYDSTIDYEADRGVGDCQSDRLYWTTLAVPPSCLDGNGDPNPQYILKSAFYCQDAKLRMTGMGQFTDVMVQHHNGGSGPASWQRLAQGDSSSLVECMNDDGVHGDGTANVYAQAGSGLAPFTNDPNASLDWGSGEATVEYTVYDGNYLNWRENPVTVSWPKMDILKAVTRNLLNSVEDVNIGVMRFSGSAGGRVIQDIVPLNTNRTQIINTIQALPAGGNTPLAETLYESALYWRGMGADFGNYTETTATIPDPMDPTSTITITTPNPADIDVNAFVGAVPGTYEQPVMPSCARNFNVLLSDGQPVSDSDAQTDAPTLPGWGSVNPATCAGTGDGRCLDEIGRYLAEVDITSDPNDPQYVVTHTIGFAINLPILADTALASGGQYFPADNTEELTNALMRIVEIALDKGLSFSAPTVAVNTFNRTTNLNDLYISTFLPESRVHWPGNLKKYTIEGGTIKDANGADAVETDPASPEAGFFKSSSQSFWTVGGNDGFDVEKGGAANVLPLPANRRVFTNYGISDDLAGTGSNAISTGNTALTLADFGLTGSPDEPTLAEIIDWTLGADTFDEDEDTGTTERNSMGDPLHSQPAAVVYGGDPADPDVVVFTATNDGYFHAIDGRTGVEKWAFIPKQLLQDLPDLALNDVATYKHYGIDGDIVPVVYDQNEDGIINGSDFVHVIFGMRRGGNYYYSLDVTDPDNPELNWVRTYPEFGQSWSRPVVARVDINTTRFSPANATLKSVVIVGEGYDTVHDTPAWPSNPDNTGAGISMLDLFTGDRIWRAGRTNADLTLPTMTRSMPTAVRAIDFSGDGFIDRMYSVDVGGQVFRFDITRAQGPSTAVTGGVIARFGAEGVATAGDLNAARVYNAPDVSIFTDPVLNRRFIAIGVGSGYRAHPLNTNATDAYYSLRDPDLFAKLDQPSYNGYNIATANDMAEVNGQVRTVIGPLQRGWKFTLPPNMMVLSASATFDNSVFFLGYSPDASSTVSCNASPGSNILFRVDVANGDPVANNLDTMLAADSNAARTTALEQGGIAPTPAFLFPGNDSSCPPGETCTPPPLGCIGVECFDPGFQNNPVRTLWTQDGIE